MRLRGKDFCNCDHAQLLHKAVREAHALLKARAPINAATVLREALEEHSEARLDLWGADEIEIERIRKQRS